MSSKPRRRDNVFIKGTGPKVRPPRIAGLRKPRSKQQVTERQAPPQAQVQH